MADRPILFSGPMVRALLDGRKTQTRRVMKPQPEHLQHHTYKGQLAYEGEHRMWCWNGCVVDNIFDFGAEYADNKELATYCPYGKPGDRLWVRETFAIEDATEYMNDSSFSKPTDRPLKYGGDELEGFWLQFPRYRATEPDTMLMIKQAEEPEDQMAWTPSIHMPRWASRITLEITNVRVQRLQDISAVDAIDEGVMTLGKEWLNGSFPQYEANYKHWLHLGLHHVAPPLGPSPLERYAMLWDQINGEGAWANNPWVWALTFEVVQQDRAAGLNCILQTKHKSTTEALHHQDKRAR